MNKKQIIVLWIGIVIIVLMCLFPPYILKFGASGTVIASSYCFILNPPETGDSYKLFDRKAEIMGSRLDLPKLSVQWVMVAVIIGGLLVTLKDKKKD